MRPQNNENKKNNIMAKKCPHCGSYNVDPVVSRFVEHGVVQAGRMALSMGAGLVTSLFMPNHGAPAAREMWRNTKPNHEFQGYHCNNCGKDFA